MAELGKREKLRLINDFNLDGIDAIIQNGLLISKKHSKLPCHSQQQKKSPSELPSLHVC